MSNHGFTKRCVGTVAALAALVALGNSEARGEEMACRAAIAKATAKFEAGKMKALQKCRDGVLKGKVTPPCPDTKAADKISGAKTKMDDTIAKDCEVADIALIFPGSNCPLFATVDESGSCDTGAMSTIANLQACAFCLTETNVDSMISFLFDAKNASSDGDTLKCQRSIGKNGAKFFAAKRKALAKCADAVIKNGSGSCPDAKAADKIGKAAAKLAGKLDGDCAGFGQDDFGGPCFCPGFDVPGAPPACGGPLQSLADLKTCVKCVMDHKSECLTDVSAPSLGSLPAECRPNCGNGSIDAGETCDDGNVLDGDSCPSDCAIAPCISPSGTVTATINVSGTTADLSALTVFFTYPDGKVRIPGTGNQQSVVDSFTVTNGTGGLTPNDLDYAARALLTDAFFPLGYPPLQVTFDKCNGASVVDGDFKCWVEFASDSAAAVLSGVTCSVDVP